MEEARLIAVLDRKPDRVYRGGSWYHSSGDARAARRDIGNPDSQLVFFGIRLVREASWKKPD